MSGARTGPGSRGFHGRGRGFSLIEMLIALTISATLLTATLSALNASFQSYKVVTDSSSTHVVTRNVMNRVMGQIRMADPASFQPFPAAGDTYDPAQNPQRSTWIQFDTLPDVDGTWRRIRIGPQEGTGPAAGIFSEAFDLLYSETLYDESGAVIRPASIRPLLRGLRSAEFTLQYQPGPTLVRATVDLTILPNDVSDGAGGVTLAAKIESNTIRMVSTVEARQQVDTGP